jgi:hypothetical protein
MKQLFFASCLLLAGCSDSAEEDDLHAASAIANKPRPSARIAR